MKKIFGLTLLCVWILVGCGKNEKQSQIVLEAVSFRPFPPFDADSAYSYIDRQVSFGPRVPNTKAHEQCKVYLVSFFKRLGWQVIEQKFETNAYDGTALKLTNIIAQIQPQLSKRILLVAHWDTRPFADQDSVDQKIPIDGANDGGSGVAVLMELARTMSQSHTMPGVGIDLLLTDGEDYGQPDFDKGPYVQDSWCLGAQYWAKHPHTPGYRAYYGILLDMVGAKDAKFYMEGVSVKYALDIQRKVWMHAQSLGYGAFFISQLSEEILDDHAYINAVAKIPTIDIIEYEPSDGAYFSRTWHTHQDNMKYIDANSLRRVGEVLLKTIYNE